MVHPSVPAILFTPICPHSLNFRCAAASALTAESKAACRQRRPPAWLPAGTLASHAARPLLLPHTLDLDFTWLSPSPWLPAARSSCLIMWSSSCASRQTPAAPPSSALTAASHGSCCRWAGRHACGIREVLVACGREGGWGWAGFRLRSFAWAACCARPGAAAGMHAVLAAPCCLLKPAPAHCRPAG